MYAIIKVICNMTFYLSRSGKHWKEPIYYNEETANQIASRYAGTLVRKGSEVLV